MKDPQIATRSDYSDLLGCSSGNGYASRSTGYQYDTTTAAKVQVFNSTPPNWNHHPAPVKTNQVAQPYKPFQLLLLHMETSEWS